MIHKNFISGRGAIDADLSVGEMREIVEAAFATINFGERVLAIIPDNTRDDATDVLFPIVAEILAEKGVKKFHALVAQGTHAPMPENEKLKKSERTNGICREFSARFSTTNGTTHAN